VVHSRDDQEVGMAHEVKSASIFPDEMGQYWLGKTKSKQAFRSTQNTFKKLPRILKNYLTEFSDWLTD